MCPVVALSIFSGGWQAFHSLGWPETFGRNVSFNRFVEGDTIRLPRTDHEIQCNFHVVFCNTCL